MGKQYRPRLETKDGEGNPQQVLVPEVNKQVLEQVSALANNQKKASDILNSEMVELRKIVEEGKAGMDPLVEAKLAKYQESIVTRQEALDKEAVEQKGRIDALDLAFQRGNRSSAGGVEAEAQLFKDALEHRKTVACQGMERKRITEADVNIEEYKGYCAAFVNMMVTNVNTAGISAEDMKFLSVGSDPDGGILVPPTVSNRITKRIWEMDPVRQLADIQNIGTDAFEEVVDIDEAGDAWQGETQTPTETDTPKFNKIYIPVHEQRAEPKATQKLLEDAAINIEQWLADKVAKKFARTEGAAFITGNGLGKPRGILTYSTFANSNENNVYNFGQIEYVPAGDSVIDSSAIIRTYYHLLEDYQSRATWLMNRFTVMATMLLEDGDGRPIWMPGQSSLAGAGTPSTLMGTPLRMSSTMPVIAANSLSFALADWQEFYTIVDRLGITILRDPYTAKPFVKFYTRRRVGGGVRNYQAGVLMKMAAS